MVSATTRSSSPLRVLFFGSDSFSLPTLSALHREWTDTRRTGGGVVSQLEVCCSPPKRSAPSPVRDFAESEGLVTHTHPMGATAVGLAGFDVGIVASFGHLISKAVIGAFPRCAEETKVVVVYLLNENPCLAPSGAS